MTPNNLKWRGEMAVWNALYVTLRAIPHLAQGGYPRFRAQDGEPRKMRVLRASWQSLIECILLMRQANAIWSCYVNTPFYFPPVASGGRLTPVNSNKAFSQHPPNPNK
jgi:hypothetical protein